MRLIHWQDRERRGISISKIESPFFISNITTIIVQDLHAQELFPKIHELKRAELKFVRANLARMSRLGYVCAHGERSEPKPHSH